MILHGNDCSTEKIVTTGNEKSVEFRFNFTIFVFHASHNLWGCLKIHLGFEYLQQSWNY